MKKSIALIASLLSIQVFGAEMSAECVRTTPDRKALLESKHLSVNVHGRNITINDGSTRYTGKYEKLAKNGMLMYGSEDLLEVADQTDYAYIFVSPSLYKGRAGQVVLSVRQLGDSSGAWWISTEYKCKTTE